MRHLQQILLMCTLLLLASCQNVRLQGPTAVSELSTTTPLPAATNLPTATLPATDKPTNTPTPLPTVTETPQPTATATLTSTPTNTPVPRFAASDGFDFEQANIGRVLNPGGSSAWDGGQIFQPEVVHHDGRFHMFYSGFRGQASISGAIGYATSSDGLNWIKHPDNPILQGTQELPNLYSPAVYFDGTQWVMFVNAAENRRAIGRTILRATAPDLSGPWTMSDGTFFDDRSTRQWDYQSQPAAFISLDNELRLYYMALGGAGIQMGLATSSDGLAWTRHDDPTTTELAFDGSDPILALGESGQWDTATSGSISVLFADDQWELFYIGTTTSPFDFTTNPVTVKKPIHIGYATSEDGVLWTRHEDNPVLQIYDNCWPLLESIKHEGIYYLYYDSGCGFDGINVLWGTITEN